MRLTIRILFLALLAYFGCRCEAQVYSPMVLKPGQIDSTTLKALTEGIYRQARAKTEREKAEAIWRFFLTDGRFVKPGFWYHIAGWAYEEPLGEVLDPVKLMNSYGFGLCYHVAPLLEAAYDAGGFEDARVWFLTGHTVAEVFYEGKYHYFDSDMMGYNPVGLGPLKQRRVASVHDIEQNGNIILSRLTGKKHEDPSGVDMPWYPADVRANAIDGLAQLFTSTNDNWLYPFTRYRQGHTMDFVLRPGERMIRYFRPETNGLYYLPYSFNGTAWQEFPREFDEYHIRTEDGPRSQKDARSWGTGKIEYRPQLPETAIGEPSGKDSTMIFDMPCPYVIIDANYAMDVNIPAAGDSLTVESSVDGGRVWTEDFSVKGPFHGRWNAGPAVIVKSEHGKLTTVTGTYGYKVRITRHGNSAIDAVRDIVLTTVFQLNPRTLPALTTGKNDLQYRATGQDRTEIPVHAADLDRFAAKIDNANYRGRDGQGYVANEGSKPGEITFALPARKGSELIGFDAGGRFLDLRDGLAPDKLTAEVRKVTPWPSKDAATPIAKISWAMKRDGPYQELWHYDPKLTWRDGEHIDRTLRWPEVDKRFDRLPPGVKEVFVRYTICGMAIDDFRLATIHPVVRSSSRVQVTQIWKENGIAKSHSEVIEEGNREHKFNIPVPEGVSVENDAFIVECLRKKLR